MLRSLALATLSIPGLVAQTFVVDAANGPGTHFAEIAAAVAAVPDGAVLIVRAGDYLGFIISGKGLTIIGEAGARAGAFTISNTAPTQRVIIRDVAFRPSFAHAQCQSCQGTVLLQRIGVPGNGLGALTVQQCAQVVVDHCGPFVLPGGRPMLFSQSNTVCIGCDALDSGAPAADVYGGTLQLIDCDLTGGSVTQTLPYPAALNLASGAQVRMTGGSITATAPFGGNPIAIFGNGAMRIDPSVAVAGPMVGVTVVASPLAAVVGSGGSIGTMATATMRGPAGHLGVLLLGTVGSPIAVLGIDNEIWLAVGSVPMAAGIFGPSLAGAVTVPNNPLLLGSLFGWQGVTLGPAGGLAMTNPALFAP
jgi:hypothetical protein